MLHVLRVIGSYEGGSPMREAYEKAQRGLSEIELEYDIVLDSAVSAVAAHCGWDQQSIERLRGNASKQLREIIGRYAHQHKTLDDLGEFALREIVVYLIAQKECRSLLRKICEEGRLPYDPQDEDLLSSLRVSAVSRVLADFETLRAPANVVAWYSADILGHWKNVSATYCQNSQLLKRLLSDATTIDLIKNFTNAMTAHMKGVPAEDIQCAAEEGISRAMYRWEPDRASFARVAGIWMEKCFWSRVDRKGVSEDEFQLIGQVLRAVRLLWQQAHGRKLTDDEIADFINRQRVRAAQEKARRNFTDDEIAAFIREKGVTDTRVREALEIAATMDFKSLDEMDEQLATDRGDESAEALADGSMSLEASKQASVPYGDPYELRAITEEIELWAKKLPRSEAFAFWSNVEGKPDGNGLPPEYVVRFTEEPAIRNRLAKRANILTSRSCITELARWLPRSVSSIFAEVALKGRGWRPVAKEQRLNGEEITRRLKNAWRMLTLLAAMAVRQAPARANDIPLPPRKIFKQIDALLKLSPGRREARIRDWIEERPVDEYCQIPVSDDHLKGLRHSVLNVSVEYLPESEKQVYLLHHSERESLDEIAKVRRIAPEVAQRLLLRSELLADLPDELMSSRITELTRWLPRSVSPVFVEVALKGKGRLLVAGEQRLNEEEITRRLKAAWRILTLLTAMVLRQAPARANEIPLPPRKIFRQIDALLNLSTDEREATIRDGIEERPADEYRQIPVSDDHLKDLKRSLLEVSVEHLPDSERQVHLLHHSEQKSLDEIAEMRNVAREVAQGLLLPSELLADLPDELKMRIFARAREVAQRLLLRSEWLADLPDELIDCLPDTDKEFPEHPPDTGRRVVKQIDVNGHRAAHVAGALKLEEKSVSELLNAARRVLVLLAAISARQVAANAADRIPPISDPLLADEIRGLLQTAESERRTAIQKIEERDDDEFQGMDDIQEIQLRGVLERLNLAAKASKASSPAKLPETSQESKGES
jgi:hypothetical protein